MPVIHKYANKKGYFVKVKKRGHEKYSTYQVSAECSESFDQNNVISGQRISYQLFQSLRAKGWLYTDSVQLGEFKRISGDVVLKVESKPLTVEQQKEKDTREKRDFIRRTSYKTLLAHYIEEGMSEEAAIRFLKDKGRTRWDEVPDILGCLYILMIVVGLICIVVRVVFFG